jgi:membrane-associated phospholipid phosphatase
MLAGFSDVVASSGTIGSWHTGSLAKDANQLAAMPSLHIAWAVWCSLALWRLSAGWQGSTRRWRSARAWVRAPAILYPCLTGFAVLATGNHYLLDLLAGVATAALAVLLARAAGSACHKLVTKSPFR